MWDTFRLVGTRAEAEELLDLGQGTSQDVAENLAEMQRINDWLGGTRALTRHLFPRLLRHSGSVTLLDLGTGGAGLPFTLLNWAHRRHVPLRILAVDWSRRNLAASPRAVRQHPAILRLQADAQCLPLGVGQVDYVVSSLFLHHLSPEGLVRVLHSSYTLARKGVIMSDLVRGWLPYMAFRLIQPVFARNFLTRHDGALSVRRAYTPGEMQHLAERAGLPGARVHTNFPWRMTLVVEK